MGLRSGQRADFAQPRRPLRTGGRHRREHATTGERERAGPRPPRGCGGGAAPLREHCADLVTVSAALHWFDRPRFFAEVRRVARPGAILAVWSYYQSLIEPAIDAVLMRYASEVVGSLWSPGMELNQRAYRGLELPFEPLPWPTLHAEGRMRLEDLLQYMRTWSASQAWQRTRGTDPVETVHDDMTRAWGDPTTLRAVRWPLHGAIARVR